MALLWWLEFREKKKEGSGEHSSLDTFLSIVFSLLFFVMGQVMKKTVSKLAEKYPCDTYSKRSADKINKLLNTHMIFYVFLPSQFYFLMQIIQVQ